MYLLLATVHNIVIPGYKDITLHIFFLVLVLSGIWCFPVFVWTGVKGLVPLKGISSSDLRVKAD